MKKVIQCKKKIAKEIDQITLIADKFTFNVKGNHLSNLSSFFSNEGSRLMSPFLTTFGGTMYINLKPKDVLSQANGAQINRENFKQSFDEVDLTHEDNSKKISTRVKLNDLNAWVFMSFNDERDDTIVSINYQLSLNTAFGAVISNVDDLVTLSRRILKITGKELKAKGSQPSLSYDGKTKTIHVTTVDTGTNAMFNPEERYGKQSEPSSKSYIKMYHHILSSKDDNVASY